MEEAFCNAWKTYSKLQTCPLVILVSVSADSIRGPPYSIGAMGSVDRVITLGGGGGRKPETGIIYTWYSPRYISKWPEHAQHWVLSVSSTLDIVQSQDSSLVSLDQSSAMLKSTPRSWPHDLGLKVDCFLRFPFQRISWQIPQPSSRRNIPAPSSGSNQALSIIQGNLKNPATWRTIMNHQNVVNIYIYDICYIYYYAYMPGFPIMKCNTALPMLNQCVCVCMCVCVSVLSGPFWRRHESHDVWSTVNQGFRQPDWRCTAWCCHLGRVQTSMATWCFASPQHLQRAQVKCMDSPWAVWPQPATWHFWVADFAFLVCYKMAKRRRNSSKFSVPKGFARLVTW